ncbi:4a-hydroxytetrahydrobiopterin dehydratase [Halobacteriales archaeon QH_2_65_14]|nr:MAG: 4a-hydroxytetrahydrobiopterin dehydratase [Halobacteriales archaeon QH_2_65_14]
MADLLSDEEIEAQLPDDWERDGDEIVRTYEFDEYLDGIGFAAGAGGVAEDAWHHPEMTIGWCEVEVRLTTHDAGGITENDIDMAGRLVVSMYRRGVTPRPFQPPKQGYFRAGPKRVTTTTTSPTSQRTSSGRV